MVNGHQNWMVFSNTSDYSPIQYLCEWVSRGDCTRACLNQPNSFPDYIQSAFTYHKIFWDQIPQSKHIKTECGRGRIGPENYSLLFREKVARVEFVWNNISPCMGEYNEHMIGFACRVYCISFRNWKYLDEIKTDYYNKDYYLRTHTNVDI